MDDDFSTVIGFVFMLVIIGVMYSGCSAYEASTYEAHSRRVAAAAGWDWVGCDRMYTGPVVSRVTCLVRDADGKVVNIDNIRSD